MADYPEHEKLKAIADQSQAIYDFLEWVEMEHEFRLCVIPDYYESTYVPVIASVRGLLAEFFEIDMDKIETEKRAMLDALRAVNDA